jgi:hypothetical protein
MNPYRKIRELEESRARLLAKVIMLQVEIEIIAEDPTSDKAKDIIDKYKLKLDIRKEQEQAEQN